MLLLEVCGDTIEDEHNTDDEQDSGDDTDTGKHHREHVHALWREVGSNEASHERGARAKDDDYNE